jgi:hypothetical protein
MTAETMVKGAIVDSWLEPSLGMRDGSKLVLQVAPVGRPNDLLIVEASASVVPDRGWLQDLQENLCHGSPVAAFGRLDLNGQLLATQIEFAR